MYYLSRLNLSTKKREEREKKRDRGREREREREREKLFSSLGLLSLYLVLLAYPWFMPHSLSFIQTTLSTSHLYLLTCLVTCFLTPSFFSSLPFTNSPVYKASFCKLTYIHNTGITLNYKHSIDFTSYFMNIIIIIIIIIMIIININITVR